MPKATETFSDSFMPSWGKQIILSEASNNFFLMPKVSLPKITAKGKRGEKSI